MTEVTDVGDAHYQESGLMSIGAVAAHNIAERLKLGADAAPQIETVMREEINHLSEHFTLAFADIQTQHEIDKKQNDKARAVLKTDFDTALADAIERFNTEVTWIKSTHRYVQANWERIAAVAAAVFALGVFVGHLI